MAKRKKYNIRDIRDVLCEVLFDDEGFYEKVLIDGFPGFKHMTVEATLEMFVEIVLEDIVDKHHMKAYEEMYNTGSTDIDYDDTWYEEYAMYREILDDHITKMAEKELLND